MQPLKFDIEDVLVENDPRSWSRTRKTVTLCIVSAAAMIAGLGSNIQNPAIQQMEKQLPATSSQISLSLSLFTLFQGIVPLVWSAISEIKGRKLVYIASVGLTVVGCIGTALSPNINLIIFFRCIQGAASSSVVTIGAATLVDIYPPATRGAKMGIYNAAPLLGPSLGPILGGALATGFSWRACFWFLAIFSGASFFTFLLFFEDPWRKERSLTYHNALWRKFNDQDRQHKQKDACVSNNSELCLGSAPSPFKTLNESPAVPLRPTPPVITLSLKDINPVTPLIGVMRRRNNQLILLASGFCFAFMFLTAYATARTLGRVYQYSPFKIGLVLLSLGIGTLTGSVLGGHYSDYTFRALKDANGGVGYSEMRLRSTIPVFACLPLSIVGMGWVYHQHVHIAVVCAMLFTNGFFLIWVYSSTLAYIVDANNGRSSTAMAANSAFRGISAFLATEIAVPLQNSLGDGPMYTIWGAIVLVSELLILLVYLQGRKWRQAAEEREMASSKPNHE